MTLTIHKITIAPHNEETLQRVLDYLNQFTEYDTFEISEYEENAIVSESVKWYKLEQDIRSLSREFPDILITVHGEVEENGDILEFYCKNQRGYEQKAIISFPEFDETRMK